MLLVEAKAIVTYTCTLTNADEIKVKRYAKQNDVSLDQAIKKLWENNELDIYANNPTESDCNTEEVGYSEFNNR